MISGTPARALLIGHPTLAALACSTNVLSSIPETIPTVTSVLARATQICSRSTRYGCLPLALKVSSCVARVMPT